MDPSQANPPASSEPANPNLAPSSQGPRFSFPLPFDPIRITAGILSRWPFLAIAAILLGSLGFLLGGLISHTHHVISISLIKRKVPQTVQASEIGQAFRPAELNDATLLATLLASEPLDAALKRSGNGIAPDRARSLVEAGQVEGTDIFHITYHSPVSPEDALSFSGIWAEEINAYTQRLQQNEAQEVRKILKKEVDDAQQQIDNLNKELLEFSKTHDYLGGEAQVAAELSKLAGIDLQLEQARTEIGTRQRQLTQLLEEIRRQSPLGFQLKNARDELAALRATYTDANPLVRAKLQSIDYLSEQVAKLDGGDLDNLDAFTGTPLGNQLFLDIIDVRNELASATSRAESLERLRETTATRIATFPSIVTEYDALRERRRTLTDGLILMSNRLKEAEIFASGAPGYWQVFQAPDPRLIQPSSALKKQLALAFLGTFAGGGTALLLTILLTQRSSRRSPLECCATTRAPLVAHLTPDSFPTGIRDFWINHLAPPGKSHSHTLFWTAGLPQAEERQLWTALAERAIADGHPPPVIADLSPDVPLWDTSPPPDCLRWQSWQPDAPPPDLLRAASLLPGPARDSLSSISRWYTVASGDATPLKTLAQSRAFTQACLPPCSGTLALIAPAKGLIRKAADHLSLFLTRHFSQH